MRILEPYKNYFWEFYNSLKQNVKDKVDYVLQIVISAERIPAKFFKHLEDGIYEIRVESCERIGFTELTGSFGLAELRNSFPRYLRRG